MSSITIPYLFVPNTTIVSAQVNANFSVIASVVNGNLDNSNLSAGANISLSKLNNTQAFLDLQASSGIMGLGVGQTGDTIARVGLFSDGALKLGPGSGTAVDVGLSRSNTNTIQLNDGTLNTGTGYLDMTYGVLFNAPINAIPGGRLYMTTGSPYADHAAAATVFYGPAASNILLINNGTGYIYQTLAETSFSVGALSTGMYDVYINSASLTSISAPTTVAWGGLTTPPTRSTDNYGRPCKSGDTTKLLVGTIWVNGSSQATDSTSTRAVSNLYNTVPKSVFAQVPVTSWTYTTASWRATDANTTDGQGRVSVVQAGLTNAAMIDITYVQNVQMAGTVSNPTNIFAIALDSTTTPSSIVPSIAGIGTGADFAASAVARYTVQLTAGYHNIQMIEQALGGASGATMYGNGATASSGLIGVVSV